MTLILVEPEIPQTTGTIARLCAVTGVRLELVHPLGFSLDDKHLRRAGLDYWPHLDVREHRSPAAFIRERVRAVAEDGARFFYFSRRGPLCYADVAWRADDVLVFGRESSGLDLDALGAPSGAVVRIPMRPGLRSRNLANAASVAVYEAYRQLGFPGLG